MTPVLATAAAVAGLILATVPAAAQVTAIDPPMLAERVTSGELPPIDQRLPAVPRVVTFDAEAGTSPGRPGGEITWLARRARDIRIMNVYGYARLVGYDRNFELVPDILESIEVEDERVFTLHLRPGHRWSDGHPFTSEDFRYFWFDYSLNEELRPFGPDDRMIVNGEPAQVTIIDEVTVRYEWSEPNPEFLPSLAGARPLYLYAPAHYLQQFHADYTDAETLAQQVADSGQRNWVALHIRMGNLYEADNPALPVLQPWRNTTRPPSERFIFVRNPYFHRVDEAGNQLPYLDRVIVNIVDSALIPARAGAGEADLQARSLSFDNVPFLAEASDRGEFELLLWPTAYGSTVALYPNMHIQDPAWRTLNRDVRFRRALSLAINRNEINQVVFFGLATPGNNTALSASPLFDPDRLTRWATYDPEQANALLDEIGLTERNADGIRLMSDGRPLEVVVESTGERGLETDILELVADTWRQIGVNLFITSSQREVFRTRIFAGEAMMSVFFGLDNALFTASTVPSELAPVDQNWLQYPMWGQYVQTNGGAGEPVDMPFAERLVALYDAWRMTTDPGERMAITTEMLEIHADHVTSIGTVQGVLQPVVIDSALRNVPEEGIYSWDPGAHFGLYRPDTFWLDQ